MAQFEDADYCFVFVENSLDDDFVENLQNCSTENVLNETNVSELNPQIQLRLVRSVSDPVSLKKRQQRERPIVRVCRTDMVSSVHNTPQLPSAPLECGDCNVETAEKVKEKQHAFYKTMGLVCLWSIVNFGVCRFTTSRIPSL